MKARARGYTVVEVAISMTLFAIGAVAVIAMERTSVQGDSDARQQDVATGIANEWVARLQRDELSWKVTSASNTQVARAATNYLSDSYATSVCGPIGVDAAGAYTPTFNTPAIGLTFSPTTIEGRGYAYDIFGHDLYDATNATYCVAVSECFEDAIDGNLIQATVLVFWARKISSNPSSGWCSSSTTFTGPTFDPQMYRSVSSTVLLQAGGGQK
jgi:hypothetical protein